MKFSIRRALSSLFLGPALLSIFFFLSGFAGLVYQIVWLRMAFSHFGVITPVLSVTVSVFMLGLGIGSWLVGRGMKAIQHSPVKPLIIYAWIELAIGCSALTVPFLFALGDAWLLRLGAMNSLSYLLVSAAFLGGALFVPCVLMGATYPAMMAHVQRLGRQTESFSALYIANVAGAFCGAVLTPLVFVELLGFRHTLFLAVGANLSVGLLALARGRVRSAPPSEEADPRSAHTDRLSTRFAYAVLGATGFTAMALEVVWTRTFTPVLGTTVYAFAAILGVYLVATAAGSWHYRRSLIQPAKIDFWIYLAMLPPSVLLPLLLGDPRFSLPVVVVGSLIPFCFLLGYVTPRIIDSISQGDPALAGRAYAVNIVGCVLGPLVASYLLLPYLGARNTMISMSVLLGLVLWAQNRNSLKKYGVAYGAALLFCLTLETYEEFGQAQLTPKEIRRDYAATVISGGDGYRKRLYVNGVGITVLTPLTKSMAHMPLLCLKQPPRNALAICFGMGTSFRSLLSWGIDVTAVELIPSVKKAFPYYFSDAAQCLTNPKGRIVIDDGRRYLKRTTEQFDVITLDPPPPVEAAGSGMLYSAQFYSELKTHLSSGGILQQWWPGGEVATLLSVARTLHESFP